MVASRGTSRQPMLMILFLLLTELGGDNLADAPSSGISADAISDLWFVVGELEDRVRVQRHEPIESTPCDELRSHV